VRWQKSIPSRKTNKNKRHKRSADPSAPVNPSAPLRRRTFSEVRADTNRSRRKLFVPSFDSPKPGKLGAPESSDRLRATAAKFVDTVRGSDQQTPDLVSGRALIDVAHRAGCRAAASQSVRPRVHTEAGLAASTVRAMLTRFSAASLRWPLRLAPLAHRTCAPAPLTSPSDAAAREPAMKLERPAGLTAS
jgi:hypothetical protein